jgi:hypothetical protein
MPNMGHMAHCGRLERLRACPFVTRLALIAAVLSLLGAGAGVAAPAAAPAREHAARVTQLKSCKPGYRRAVIGGEQKCLHAGQFCAKSRAREYRRYGFVCKPGSGGRYRLSRR